MVRGSKGRRQKNTRQVRRRKRFNSRQNGGVIPLAALLPALVAAGKAAATGGIAAGASWGVKKALDKIGRKRGTT